MDELPPEPEAPPGSSATERPAAAKKPQASVAEKITAWGNAVTALFKALALALVILLVSGATVLLVWRDQHSRVVMVDVSAEAEKTLKALGADIDLRMALVDALNERLHGVQRIVAFEGLSFATDKNQSDAISFKPFGLELSTYDISRMVGVVLDSPARPAARLEMFCVPLACADPAARRGTLIVNLSGPNGHRNASYSLALRGPGLRRSLLQSVQRTADLVLEQNYPLIAGVWFLNRAIATDVFPDLARRDYIRADGAAVAAGHKTDASGCLADLVIGASLIYRGQLADGVAAERRASASPNLTCKVNGETNIIFALFSKALFDRSAYDNIVQAHQRLPKLRRGDVDDLVYFRIPHAQLLLEILQKKAAFEAAPAVRTETAAPQTGSRSMVANELIAMLRHSQEALPQDASAGMSHGLLMTLWWAAKAVLRDDLAGRLSTARAMMDAVRRYEANDQYPRALFWLQGELAMEIARAASDALDRAPVEQVRLARELGADSAAAQSQASNLLTNAIDENLDSATVAFERAEATGVVAPLVEPYTDAQMAELHGGALYAKGDEASARKAYARALDKFIEAGEPVEQVVVFAKIVAHWASLRIAEGACKEGAHVVPDRAWEDSWARLSNTPYDVCRLAKPGYGVEQPVPLASIEPLIKHAVMGCPPPPGPDETKQMKRGDAFKKRIALIDCQRNKVDLMAGSLPSAEAMDAEITQALDTVR